MNCVKCGAKIPDGSSNCKLCGATVPEGSGFVCSRCGKQSHPGEKFCGGCGNPLTAGAKPPAEPDLPVDRKKFNPYPILIAIVASITVILGILSLGDSDFTAYGRTYESTIDKYVDHHCKGRWDEKLSLYHEDVLDEELDDRSETEGDLIRRGSDFVSGRNEQLGYGWDYTYEITENENLTGSDLAEAKEWMQDEYGLRITAAKEVKLKIKMTGYMDSRTDTHYVTLVKIGWDWYLID